MPKHIKDDLKARMIHLINSGKSLNEISKMTGLSKTTIYYHYRKRYGKIIKQPNISRHDFECLGEFLGVVAGDGYANIEKGYHYKLRIFLNINEEGYAEKLIKMLKEFLDKSPHKYVHLKGNCIHLSIISKPVFNLVKEYLFWESKGHRSKSRSVRLRKIEDTDKFKIGFLRGCIDTDGYIGRNKISFDTASRGLHRNINAFLKSLDIKFSTRVYRDKRPNRSTMYNISIRKESREKFMTLISPKNIKCAGWGSNPRQQLSTG